MTYKHFPVSILIMSLSSPVTAQVPTPFSPEAFQLQQLVEKSEAQLQSIRELLKVSNQDAKSLESASRSLERLSAGIETSINQFQGTKAYQDALLQLQFDNGKQVEKGGKKLKPKERFDSFQRESVNANLADSEAAKKLEMALRTAPPGFVPKIEAQAQLGVWQSNVRTSAQLTELLFAVHKMAGAYDPQDMGGLASLVRGSEMQNQKQREVTVHEPK